MAQLISNKSEAYQSELPASAFYPALKLSEFQALFHFLEDETEAAIVHNATIERITVHRQLTGLTAKYESMEVLSMALFEDESTAESLYKQAVFCKTASALIGNRLATDATKEAADRQEALESRVDNLLSNYRNAIDQLLLTNSGYTFEMI
ncbi:head completion/stabilization protein [Psychromonas aquimarina]|uniref:head completion/stabilization protein n=1 Tax=Psychromonas aquimarina TaxID=444919 RepID=UPI0003FFD516|nr:head completion/stabilization protein [Psychromonas aquimarina]